MPYRWSGAGLLIWFLTLSASFAEVTLRRASIEAGLPGEWTHFNLALKNDGPQPKEVRLELVAGELDSGLSSVFWQFSMPARSEWDRSFPFLIPEQKLPTVAKDGALDKASSSSKASPKTNALQKTQNNNVFKINVKFYVDGSIKKLDEVLGNYLKEPVLHSLQENANLSKTFAPTDPRSTLALNHELAPIKFKYLGQNSRLRFQGLAPSASKILTASDLAPQSILAMNIRHFSSAETLVLKNWIEAGGLAILNSSKVQETPFHRLLEFAPSREALFFPHFEKSKSTPIPGVQHLFSKAWQGVNDESGLCLGAVRNLGLGKILVLNVNLADLQKINEKWTVDLLHRSCPEKLKPLMNYGDGEKATLQQLSKLSGRTVWSKTMVVGFLFSLVGATLLLSTLPYFKSRREARWALWMSMVIAWTGMGLVIHLLSLDLSTKLTSLTWNLKSPEGDWNQEWGVASLVSGEKRRFPLGFQREVNWYPMGLGVHHDKELSPQGLDWSNFSLTPQIEQKIKWHGDFKALAKQEAPQLKVGEKWELSTPKTWKGETLLCVIGRRSWLVNGGTQQQLAFEKLAGLHDFPESSLVQSFLSSEKDCFNPHERAWLFRPIPQASQPFSVPKDVVTLGKTMECWKLQPQIQAFSLTLPAGTEAWTFNRGGEKRREDASFDGLQFRAVHGCEIQMELPPWAKSLKVSKLTLQFSEKIDPSLWKMSYLNQARQEKNIPLVAKNAQLPQEAWLKDGYVVISIKSKSGTSLVGRKEMEPEIQSLPLLGLEITGEQRD